MAVELLVRCYDGPGGRRAGDIISAKDVPCTWGAGEGPPTYTIVRVEGANIGQIRLYAARHVLKNPNADPTDPKAERLRSRFRCDLNTLPNFNALENKYTVTATELADNAIDRRTET